LEKSFNLQISGKEVCCTSFKEHAVKQASSPGSFKLKLFSHKIQVALVSRMDHKRTADVIALSTCELFELSRYAIVP
jgi:hypothetical protein